ncbi:MAG TPA: winged helix-turn-helix domain-containing protein [Pyrinomonadaceae bacterium]|nr:winged helix-turn-helix domain-containing protein [Pyrinomonadaceae bacterium]
MQNPEHETSRSRLEDDVVIEGRIIRPQLNRIEDQGRVIQVQPKVMAVLMCLANQPGRVVTKEHLLQTVWADTHVTQHVLTRAISELRKIFHDDPESPYVIETIPKTGYRLIAELSKAHPEEDKHAARDIATGLRQNPIPAPRPRVFRQWWVLPTTLTGVGMMMVFLVFLFFLIGRIMHQH